MLIKEMKLQSFDKFIPIKINKKVDIDFFLHTKKPF